MLVLSRRADESIVIQPADGVDSSMTLAQLFANGPILITLLGGTGRRVKMGIEAPEQLAIPRKDVAQPVHLSVSSSCRGRARAPDLIPAYFTYPLAHHSVASRTGRRYAYNTR